MPDSILIAAAAYGDPDGGSLDAQAPAGEGNGNVERDEYYVLHLAETGVPGFGSSRLSFSPGWPNPFAGKTALKYFLPAAGEVELGVYDVAGRLVTRLPSGRRPAGDHVATWDGRDRDGRQVPSGIYFVRLVTGAERIERKVVLLR